MEPDSKPKRSIPLFKESPYRFVKGARFLVMSADLSGRVTLCKAEVRTSRPEGAELVGLDEACQFPKPGKVFLVEFSGKDVLTHHCDLRLDNGKVTVGLPTKTEKEQSQLAPFTGRSDYRVRVGLPVQVRICQGAECGDSQWPCDLFDLSRGGMSLRCPVDQPFAKGQTVDIRVVSWEYPVRMMTKVLRVWRDGDRNRVAVLFPDDMSLSQRELVSTFILHVQRRDALSRALPSTDGDHELTPWS